MSSAYCLLYKLFTLKLTRRQVQAMLNHVDSPYIRGLGFMYVRSVNSLTTNASTFHYCCVCVLLSMSGIVSLRWISGTGLWPTWTTPRSVLCPPPASGPVLQAVRTCSGH